MSKPVQKFHHQTENLDISMMSRKDRIKGILLFFCRRTDALNLPDAAGSISFTIILGLVPMLALLMAIFTKFPQFGTLQSTMESYFAQGMIPKNIAETILNYLNAFASKAAKVSIVGGLALLFTTISTISTIESAFGRIWQIVMPRSLVRRVILYIGISIAATPLLGISIYLTTHIFLSKHGIISWLPIINSFSGPIVAVIWTTVAFTLLYRILPHRLILWRDAAAGGFFASIAFEIAIRAFAFFIVHFSSYERIYGALAAFPVFMLWIYISACIMLLGAVVAAVMPDIRNGRWHVVPTPGSRFSDAMKIIDILYSAGLKNEPVRFTELEFRTHLSANEAESCLAEMRDAGWVALEKRPFFSSLAFGRSGEPKWLWTGDANSIMLADIFRKFAFVPHKDDALAMDVDNVISSDLNVSLADYFADEDRNEPETVPSEA